MTLSISFRRDYHAGEGRPKGWPYFFQMIGGMNCAFILQTMTLVLYRIGIHPARPIIAG